MLTTITAMETTTSEMSTTSKVSMGKEDFLTLLVAQLENQDPLDPLDNAEFVAQLAQFSSLEQLIGINENMEESYALNSSSVGMQALGLLDREVVVEGNSLSLENGSATINYSLEGDADDVYIGIYDSAGELVLSESLGGQIGVENSYLWDGKDANGNSAQDGIYTFELEASGTEGAVNVVGHMTGTIDGINYNGNNPVLLMGGIEIGLEEIISVN